MATEAEDSDRGRGQQQNTAHGTAMQGSAHATIMQGPQGYVLWCFGLHLVFDPIVTKQVH